jgi:thiamine pyrophosphate-dependent acetolactate synthase large subunit-like protein
VQTSNASCRTTVSGRPPSHLAQLKRCLLVSKTGCVLLNKECDAVLADIVKVPNFAELVAQQAQLEGLKHDDNFQLIARVGRAIEPHLNLLGKHADLVLKVTSRCGELVSAGNYASYETLSGKLAQLKIAAKQLNCETPLDQRVMFAIFENPLRALGILACGTLLVCLLV